MQADANQTESSVAVRTDLAAIFVSLELSRSKWLITSLSPGAGEKMSKFVVPGGDVSALLERFEHLQRKASARSGRSFRIVSIQEAGLDGFWIHRVLEDSGIESYVVDPASIAISRRRRRAKTDRIDGETLVRALLAHKRGEPRVCAMLHVPTPDAEDSRRLVRERKALINERIRHVNRIKGLLFSQGVSGYEPLNRDRRERLEALMTGEGRPLPKALKAQISRELARLELLIEQIGDVRRRATPSLPRPNTQPEGQRCCSTSGGSARSLRRFSGPRVCRAASIIGGRWPPMRGSPRHLGRADRSARTKASRSRAIRGYARRSSRSHGCGCGINRPLHLPRGSRHEYRKTEVIERNRQSSRWPANSS